MAPSVPLRRDLCNAQMLQVDQNLGRKPEFLRNPPDTGAEASGGEEKLKERLQLRVPLGQSHSSEQLPWEGSSLQLQLVLEILHVLDKHSLFLICSLLSTN